jgi:N-acetylglutamate synthase/N-acetylornithine aminotransferase
VLPGRQGDRQLAAGEDRPSSLPIPNLGRILAAVGNAGIADLDASKVGPAAGRRHRGRDGGRAASYTEEQGKAVMAQPKSPCA